MEKNLCDYIVNSELEVRDEGGISDQCTSSFSTLVNKKRNLQKPYLKTRKPTT